MKRLLLLMIFLTACTGGANEFSSRGSDGLQVELIRNAPPDYTYEDQQLPVEFIIRNQGTADVPYQNMRLTFLYDPLYIAGKQQPFPLKDPVQDLLFGRSPEYPGGDSNLFSVPEDRSFRTKQFLGTRELPKTTFTANLCYTYTTIATASVCIDTNLYENVRQQSCSAEDVRLRSQGAPIAVTKVDIDALPGVAGGVVPRFRIHLQDIGNGYIVAPASVDIDDACIRHEIPENLASSVLFKATLMGTELKCRPGPIVRLHEGKADIVCDVDDLDSRIYDATQNFQSTITMEAAYHYTTSHSREITIERDQTRTETLLQPIRGYVYENGKPVLDENEQPVVACDYYAADPTKAPAKYEGMSEEHRCACSRDRCNDYKRKGGSCFPDLCLGSAFCCAPPVEKEEEGPVLGSQAGESGVYEFTYYFLPVREEYTKWSSTGNTIGSSEACRMSEGKRGFYEDVRCQGSGRDGDRYYSYLTIKPEGPSADGSDTVPRPETKSGTVPKAKRTIAADMNPGHKCTLPEGTKVYLDFGDAVFGSRGWSGEYIVEDVGQDVKGCEIDLFVGEGKQARDDARKEIGNGLGQKQGSKNGLVRVTIVKDTFQMNAGVFFMPDCDDETYGGRWSNGRAHTPASVAESNLNKLFYEDVLMNGFGICDGEYYQADIAGDGSTYIQPTKDASEPSTAIIQDSHTLSPRQIKRKSLVAINGQSSCGLTMGDKVALDFGNDDYDGNYVIAAQNPLLEECELGIYAGRGRARHEKTVDELTGGTGYAPVTVSAAK
ncbi:MAG: 3D domain-containing protein [Candidatus Woesearchaeota archaeon]|nr:3D domain-containing protein [Candidatus Woesearchaeota archaeon]